MFIVGLIVGAIGGFGIACVVAFAHAKANPLIPITEGQWWEVRGIGAVQITGFRNLKNGWGDVIGIKWIYSADSDDKQYPITPEDLWKTGVIIDNITAWRMAQTKALSNVVEKQAALAEVEALGSASRGRAKVKKHRRRVAWPPCETPCYYIPRES